MVNLKWILVIISQQLKKKKKSQLITKILTRILLAERTTICNICESRILNIFSEQVSLLLRKFHRTYSVFLWICGLRVERRANILFTEVMFNVKVNIFQTMASLVPCGTAGDTELKEMQVSWRTSEAISRRCSSARGTGVVTRQTVSQLCPVSHLPCVVCTGWTLAHTSAVLKVAQLISTHFFFFYLLIVFLIHVRIRKYWFM